MRFRKKEEVCESSSLMTTVMNSDPMTENPSQRLSHVSETNGANLESISSELMEDDEFLYLPVQDTLDERTDLLSQHGVLVHRNPGAVAISVVSTLLQNGVRASGKTSAVSSGKSGSRGLRSPQDNTVDAGWKPTECPKCFSEFISFRKVETGFNCACDECEHVWEEVWSSYWYRR